VSFFESSPPAPPRQAGHRLPPWAAPPENELGVPVPIHVLLAQNDEFGLGLTDVVAYSTGFALRLGLRLHPGTRLDPGSLLGQFHGSPTGGDEQLRFGVEFSDGRKATNQVVRRPPGEEETISLVSRGGSASGGGLSFDIGYWVYPLPSPGKLTVAVEWPGRSLPETRHDLDAGVILEAAGGSAELWEDTRPVGRRPPPSTGEIRIS
jgi:hypothetical protein